MKNRVVFNNALEYCPKITDFRTTSSIIAVLCVLIFYNAMVSRAVFASDTLINCDAHEGVCSQSLENITVSMEITPRPVKAMQELLFKVSISGPQRPENPSIDLGMPGMKMGPNRVQLKSTGKGVYEGKGVIVRCPSGRRTWFANVTVPNSGEVKFIFDVVY